MRLPRFVTAFSDSPGGVAGAVLVVLVVAAACLGPVVAPYSPNVPDYADALQPPTLHHWGGTDEFGRDVLSRVLYGARISLGVAGLGVAAGLLAGILLGLATGYYGGRLDDVVMRIIDVLLAFPGILLAIAMVAVLGPGLQNLVLAIGIFGVPGFTRLVRGSTLQVSGMDYIEAVRAQGARSSWILLRHVLPNIMAPLIVIATLRLGGAILTESALAFLGLGAPPPTPEWGAILSDAKDNLVTSPYLGIAPSVTLVITVLGFNLLGDGLRDALDPRLRM
ncbi:MAG TPA: ABC transporter permease [bacterium]|nr:ABC transporter permease [bacterium]